MAAQDIVDQYTQLACPHQANYGESSKSPFLPFFEKMTDLPGADLSF
jgi:hypothetical protein